jgi:colanic acid biosynthesis glycosyl transferase WcaI
MRILILTQWYAPEPVELPQELARTLTTLGHRVEVLTGFPNYPSGRLYPDYKLRIRQRETVAGVPVIRVPLYPNHSRSGLLRAVNYLTFALSASCLGLWRIPKPDVIFVYHPPLTIGIPAVVLSRRWRVPFVYQIQDMWPETLSATGMLNNKTALRWIGALAHLIYRQASALCVISPGFRRNLLSKGVPDEKIHIIPNWAETETDAPEDPDPRQAQNLGLAGRFNVMFAGNIGEAQGLETVLSAAQRLGNLPDVQFVFVGDGVALPRLRDQAQNLQNVRFLGRYPAESMPALYALADVLLVHLRDEPLFRITIPHKILSYMASGKPILAAVTGDAASVVTEARAGLTCAPQDAQAMADAVKQLYRMDPATRREYGDHGLAAARTTYNRDHLVGRIESVLQQTVGAA